MPAADRDLADLALLVEAARRAGAAALASFRGAQQVWFKAGGSPVSEADLAADRLLREHLLGERPEYGWLSEETVDSTGRLASSRVFVIDPIDGTRGFLAGTTDWAVSAAIVAGGRPRAGVLFAPAQGRMFTAVKGGGAFCDGERLVLARPQRSGLRVAGPRKLVRAVKEVLPNVIAQEYGSSLALRLASVALGRYDIALSGGNSRDWDLAAADLVLAEAGARLTGIEGNEPRYNRPELSHPPLVAAAEPLHGTLLKLLGRAAEMDQRSTASRA